MLKIVFFSVYVFWYFVLIYPVDADGSDPSVLFLCSWHFVLSSISQISIECVGWAVLFLFLLLRH